MARYSAMLACILVLLTALVASSHAAEPLRHACRHGVVQGNRTTFATTLQAYGEELTWTPLAIFVSLQTGSLPTGVEAALTEALAELSAHLNAPAPQGNLTISSSQTHCGPAALSEDHKVYGVPDAHMLLYVTFDASTSWCGTASASAFSVGCQVDQYDRYGLFLSFALFIAY